MAALPKFTPDQLSAYLDRINFPRSDHADDQRTFLNQLVRRQLECVPFESLSLHYSADKKVSIDPDDLYDKIVRRRRGGYCLENNTFFGIVLRSFNFQVIGVVCRISMASRGVYDGSWRGMSHMANVVTVDGKKYLVDVGFGADGPTIPLPLGSDGIQSALPNQQLKLEHRTLPQHVDTSQKVWVYSQKRGAEAWADVYHFLDAEFFPADFEILNYHAMTQGIWSRVVIAQKFFLSNEDPSESEGLLLVRDELKSVNSLTQQTTVIKKFTNEEQRLAALEEHFALNLTDGEKLAIKGQATELQ